MKKLLLSTSVLIAATTIAHADSVSITNENFTTLPSTAFVTAPVSTTGTFSLSVSGSIAGDKRSPWNDSDNNSDPTPYSILGEGGCLGCISVPPNTATYNVNDNVFSFLWGSPDIYNQVAFYTGVDGTGSLISLVGAANGTFFNGPDLACYTGTFGAGCTQVGFDFVTFTDNGGIIGSVVLTDTGQAALEYGNIAAPTTHGVPGPIVGAGLPGLLMLGAGWWLRRRKKLAG